MKKGSVRSYQLVESIKIYGILVVAINCTFQNYNDAKEKNKQQ